MPTPTEGPGGGRILNQPRNPEIAEITPKRQKITFQLLGRREPLNRRRRKRKQISKREKDTCSASEKYHPERYFVKSCLYFSFSLHQALASLLWGHQMSPDLHVVLDPQMPFFPQTRPTPTHSIRLYEAP